MVKLDDCLLLGIEPFDEHHKYMVKLLNMTYEMLLSDERRSKLEEVLEELAEFADSHFTAEEQWMDTLNYPKHHEHKIEHDEFSCRVVHFQRELATRAAPDGLETLHFLQKWLVDHITRSDVEYGRFIHGGCI